MSKGLKWILMICLVPPAIALFVFIGGEIVMHLWNWLIPPIVGWREITFWQGLGLLALCRILFGGFGLGGGGHRNSRRRMEGRIRERIRERMDERWEHMTPEEREKFRQGLHDRGGRTTPLDSNPSG